MNNLYSDNRIRIKQSLNQQFDHSFESVNKRYIYLLKEPVRWLVLPSDG
jgi:hypothetical protein